MHQLTSKNQKCTNWPQIDLEHLMVKNTYSRDPHFGQFRPVARRFRDKVVENRKNRKWTDWTVKSTPYTLSNYPEAQMWQFCSTTRHFRDTRLLKIGKIGNVLIDLRLTLDTWQSKVYTYQAPPRPKFGSVLLFDQPFLRYKVVENLKNSKFTQNELRITLSYLAVKSTLYYYLPLRPKFW